MPIFLAAEGEGEDLVFSIVGIVGRGQDLCLAPVADVFFLKTELGLSVVEATVMIPLLLLVLFLTNADPLAVVPCVALLLVPFRTRSDMMARRSEKARSCSLKKDESAPPARRPRFHRIRFWNCCRPRGMGRASRCGLVMMSQFQQETGYQIEGVEHKGGKTKIKSNAHIAYQLCFQQLLRGRPNGQEGGLCVCAQGYRFIYWQLKVPGVCHPTPPITITNIPHLVLIQPVTNLRYEICRHNDR